MNKLKNKVFYTILGILTISLLSFIVVFNIQNYLEQKNNIRHSLNVLYSPLRNNDMPPLNNDNMIDKNTRFIDTIAYTVLLDNDNNIKEIINHSSKNVSSEITSYIKKILASDKIKKEYIGNLYTENYSYAYNKANNLIVVDNTFVKENLLTSLKNSIIIFIVFEILIIYISKLITIWITKPVNETFNKQKEFIADASHELKTPLSVIVASCEVLENNPKEKKWINNIKNEADRMNNLIKDLLELASTENKDSIEFINGNLSKAVELSCLTFEGRAYEKKIKLVYNIDDNIIFKMNENSIRQVVEILLDNAIKHSKENKTVTVNLKNQSNIELIVSNEGEPIPKGEEEKIFERFYRVDKSRNRNENRYGLGLAIAKNIIEMHNGTIKANSLNGITSFKVTFKK